MNTAPHIEHAGFVKSAADNAIIVSLIGSGCTSCHNSLCMLGESKAKEVVIATPQHSFHTGDEVIVRINPSSGYKAVLLLYLLPFVLMMGCMWLAFELGYQEGVAGLSSLLVLIPYYAVLYLFKDKLAGQCKIDIAKP